MQLQTNGAKETHGPKVPSQGIKNLRSAEAGGDSEVACIPLLYGQQIVPGLVLWQGDIEWISTKFKLEQWCDAAASYIASGWLALCAGKVKLINIYGNDKLLSPIFGYCEPTLFNDGTETIKPSVLVNSEKYIIVGNVEQIISTWEKTGWTLRVTGASTKVLRAVTYGNGLYVAVGDVDGADALCDTSINGMNWTRRTNGSIKDWNAVLFRNGYFFSFGDTGVINRSTDGITWTVQSSGVTKNLYGACTDGYRIIVVGEDGTILTSDDDGVTWTARVSGTGEDLRAVCFGDGLFVAVGTTGTTTLSSTGTTWTPHVMIAGVTETLYGICYGAGKYCIVGANRVDNFTTVLWSTDATVWNDITGDSFLLMFDDLHTCFFDGDNFCIPLKAKIVLTNNFTTFSFLVAPVSVDWYGWCFNPVATIFDYLTKLSGISHIYFPGINFNGTDYRIVCDTSGKLPSMGFELRKDLSASPISHPDLWRTVAGADVKFLGSNPAAAIYDILTNTQFGLGIPATNIDLASFNVVAEVFNSATSRVNERVYGVNIVWDKQTSGKSIIDSVCQHCDLLLYPDSGKLYLRTLYAPDETVQGTIYDFKEFTVTRQGVADLSNVFIGKYLDGEANYAETTITIKNEALIAAAGYEKIRRVDLTFFTDRIVACVRLNEIAQREGTPRSTISCVVNRRWYHLRPGDLVNIINVEYGVSETFRCVSVTPSTVDSLDINLELEEARESLYDGNYTEPEAAQGTVPRSSGTTTSGSASPDMGSATGILMPSHGGTGVANLDANMVTVSVPTTLNGIGRRVPQATDPAAVSGIVQTYTIIGKPEQLFLRQTSEDGGGIYEIPLGKIS